MRRKVRRPADDAVDVAADVHDRGAARVLRGPRRRGAHAVVDLQCGQVPGEVAHRLSEPRGDLVLAQQLLVEHRGARVGDDGPARADGRTPDRPDDPGPAVHEVDLVDPLTRPDLDPGSPGSRRQRRRQHPGPTARRGEPHVLRQHAHQPAEQSAAWRIRRDVSVHRVAQQHHSPALAGEALLGHPRRRQEEEPCQARHVGGSDCSREP
jgi:hypothetical protein